MPDPLDMSDPSHPLHQLALQMQQRHQMDARRQAMAQALMPQQQQGPAPVGNDGGPMLMPGALAVEKSPWSIGEGAFSGIAAALKKMRDDKTVPMGGTYNTSQILPYAGGQQALQNGPVVPDSGVTIGRS